MTAVPSKNPNIVFIMPDQLRHDFLSCYGASFIETPHIDSIGEEGICYTNAYSGSPACVPARMALLTGMNAIRNGVLDNLHTLRPDYKEAGIRTWPEILGEAGYHTAAIGKMHFYPWEMSYGFDHRVICEDKQWPYIRDDYHDYLEKHGLRKLALHEYGGYTERFGSAVTDVPWEHSWDRFTGREACRFIDEVEDDRPFALMVCFPGPHDPYDPASDFSVKYDSRDMPVPVPAAEGDPTGLVGRLTESYRQVGVDLTKFTAEHARINRANYAGLVKQIDHEVGAILDALRRRNIFDETVVIFTSDHGDLLGDHGLQGKAVFFEGSTHIPMMIRMPGMKGGSVNHDLVELRDITASMLQLAGCELPAYTDAQPVPGIELADAPPRDSIIGMLTGGWMVFDGRWKLCRYRESGRPFLFDLASDPHEQHNVAGDPVNRGIFEQLDAELTRAIMDSMDSSAFDRLPADISMSYLEEFGHKGWQWSYPAGIR